MKTALKTLSVTATILLVLGLGLCGWNYLVLQRPLQQVLEADSRNSGVEVNAHFGMYFAPETLVFDIRQLGPEVAPVDVFRVFLQYAQAMRDERYSIVELAHNSQTKFLIDGDYFHQLGVEYADQNPMYTMRTFTEHVRTPEGQPAFDTFEGGALGVLGAQMEQFNEFHRRWYIDPQQ